MKTRTKILLWAGAVCLVVLAAWAANPSFNDFLTSQFGTTTDKKVAIKRSVVLTNVFVRSGPGASPMFIDDLDNVGVMFTVSDVNANTMLVVNSSGTSIGHGNFLLPGLTASTLPMIGGANQVLSIPNAAGVLTNDSAGVIGWTTSPFGSALASVAIPMGAWFVNNVADGANLTAATASVSTNTADAWTFADAITNVIRTRFALPWDWDGGTVEASIQATSSGTNSTFTTNVVFGVRAAAIGDRDIESVPSWGSVISVTNHNSTNLWVSSISTTRPITVGNTPGPTKSILWELRRLGADTGDTLTNTLMVTEVRIYYNRTNRTDFPTPSP